MDLSSLKNKKIAVVGLFPTGMKTVEVLAQLGAKVTGFGNLTKKEQKYLAKQVKVQRASWVFDLEHKDQILDNDLIVTSWGYQGFEGILDQAKTKGIPVKNELDLVVPFIQGTIIGITGTTGKTTTKTFLSSILDEAKVNHQIFGGREAAFAETLLERGQVLIFELSSSYLKKTEVFRPHIAIITNLAVHHLERHDTFHDYFMSKAKIYERQDPSDYLIHHGILDTFKATFHEKPPSSQLIPFNYNEEVKKGIWRKGRQLFWRKGEHSSTFSIEDFQVPGPHNIENLMAAIAAAKLLGVDDNYINKTIPKLKPLPMHIEEVAKINGVTYYNDSTAISPLSTSWALHTLNKNIILLSGGSWIGHLEKRPYKEKLKEHVKTAIYFGENRKKYFDTLGDATETYQAETIRDAVNIAYEKSEKGDSVLFSPGCIPEIHVHASVFDRGEQFNKVVEELKGRERTKQLLHWELNKI